MSGMDKAELIKALAVEMGHEELVGIKPGDRKYDPTTGTLYCSGRAVDKNSMERAKQYFKEQAHIYQDQADAGAQRAGDLAMFYYAALAGIIYLQQAGDKVHEQIIIKDGI